MTIELNEFDELGEYEPNSDASILYTGDIVVDPFTSKETTTSTDCGTLEEESQKVHELELVMYTPGHIVK